MSLFAQIKSGNGNAWLESPFLLIGGGLLILLAIIFMIVFMTFLRLWIQCFLTKATSPSGTLSA